MNTNSKRLGIYLSVMLVLTAIATALKTVAYIYQFDSASGFFNDKALITAANIIVVLSAFGMMSYIFVASRIKLRANFSSGATYIPAGILGVATAFLAVKLFTHALTTSKYPLFSAQTLALKNISVILSVLVAIIALVSIAHHFLNAFITESKATVRAYFAIATITFLALYSIVIYLDGSISINDSSKIQRQMAFLFCAIFFLYETRISLGREMWRAYTVFGLIAAILTAYTSIPALVIYYVNGRIISSAGPKSLASLEEYLVLLALFIFILARLCLTAMLKEEKENELITALGSYAKDREEKVNESFSRYQDIFAAKQLSIFDLYGADDLEVEEEEEIEEAPAEEEKKEVIISDDAIYEAIFGKMPDRPEPEEEAQEPEEIQDDRAPEEIVQEIFDAVDEVLSEETKDSKEENEI